MKETPTTEFYTALQVAYDHFNERIFGSALPQVIFTTQRERYVMGHFSYNRWASKDGNNCHEIAINPNYVGRSSLIEMLQTLVHEMVHCWQFCHGKPGRRGYHNKQWAHKMESIGLMPSSTGRPGGAVTGERVADYPNPNGIFLDRRVT